jgi:hypothetical protein
MKIEGSDQQGTCCADNLARIIHGGQVEGREPSRYS